MSRKYACFFCAHNFKNACIFNGSNVKIQGKSKNFDPRKESPGWCPQRCLDEIGEISKQFQKNI
jgi:hypothetical protein